MKLKLSFEKKKKGRITQACGRLCQAEGTARTKAWRLENITPHTQRDEQGEEVRGRTAVSNMVPEFWMSPETERIELYTMLSLNIISRTMQSTKF